jgi:transcription termination factor NusB
MSEELTIIPRPSTITEAMNLATMISKSSFAPKGMANKPGDVLLAWQLGAEIGLSLMQALQNIAVINGKPTIYGDAALAVVQSHPHYVNHREWYEGSVKDGSRIAYCAVTRRGSPEHIVGFSMDDAKKASLWGKSGPWSQYSDRMLQMRARGFAIRDKFSDALKGIITREEAEDYPDEVKVQKPIVKVMAVSESIGIEDKSEIAFDFSRIESCENLEELKALYAELKEQCKEHPEHYRMLNNLTNDHKKYLEEQLTKDVAQNDETQLEPIPDPSPLSATAG